LQHVDDRSRGQLRPAARLSPSGWVIARRVFAQAAGLLSFSASRSSPADLFLNGPLEGRPPIGMLAFDCIARRRVLGAQRVKAEINRLAASSRGLPVAGFYTYGEIARTRGTRGFHNQTLVVLSIG
jgi:hypothetical protein